MEKQNSSLPFNEEKYKKLQKEEIFKRINEFDKLYFEVGGKLFDDNHASRVLPGFEPNIKMQILRELKNDLEVIFAVNAKDIISGKTRADNNLSYGDETIRLAKFMTNEKINVCGIMITFFELSPEIQKFEEKCNSLGFKTYHSYKIQNYPNDTDLILSQNGFGKNDYIETHKKLVLVSAPGPNSGKLQTCLSQIYNDKQNGIMACYSKYETFPVWNLPLDHLANIAYEMATVDLGDKNMIDPYYKQKYGIDAVNYNRDIDAFKIVSKILNTIFGKEIFSSPTEMGINCVGLAIDDDKKTQKAAMEEIERRHKKHKQMFESGKLKPDAMERSNQIFEKAKKLYEKLSR